MAPYCRASSARRWVSLTWATTCVGGGSWPNWITRRAYGRGSRPPGAARRTARWGAVSTSTPEREANMDQAVLNSMTDAERRLVAETEPAAVAPLDEDELLDLHSRIRRVRTGYVKNCCQAGGAKSPRVVARDGVRREPARPRQGGGLRAGAGPGQQAGRAGGHGGSGRAQGPTTRRRAGSGSDRASEDRDRRRTDAHDGGPPAWGDQDHRRHQEGRVESGTGRPPAGATGRPLTGAEDP